jgi:hypothetical protein
MGMRNSYKNPPRFYKKEASPHVHYIQLSIVRCKQY